MAKGKYKSKRLRAVQRTELGFPPHQQPKNDQNEPTGTGPIQMKNRDRERDIAKANASKTTEKRNPFRGRPQAIIGFVIGVILGPVIQQKFFTWLPGSRTQSSLRAEIVTKPDEPNCHFYLLRFINFDSIDYMHTKIQFPDPITSFKVGVSSETVLNDDQRQGGLQWGKGWDDQHKCVVEGDTLGANPNIQFSANGHMIEIQTSKLPDPTHVFGLIATTSDLEPTRSKLWTERRV